MTDNRTASAGRGRGSGAALLGWCGRGWVRFGGATPSFGVIDSDSVSGVAVHRLVDGRCLSWDVNLWSQAGAGGVGSGFGNNGLSSVSLLGD